MPSIVLAAIGFVAIIGAVASIEFAAAPAGRKGRVAAQSAAVTTCILCALIVLAVGYEWLWGPMNLPLPDGPSLLPK
jgi:hypothetical protein